MISMMMMASPIGPLQLCARGGELIAVNLPGSIVAIEAAADDVVTVAAAQLSEYFAGARTAFDLPLGPPKPGFQKLVWHALSAIPFGETRSYGAIARAIGRPSASRAVGAANGKNPIAIIVPCHRVIGASGELTGYAGGMPAKRWLLDHERRGQRELVAFASG